MKTLLSLFAAAAVFGITAPSTAQADPFCHSSRRIVNYMPCGAPVYAVYQVVGYDHCGRPVGQWITTRAPHSCLICNPSPSYGYGYHGHHNCTPSGGFYTRPRSGIRFSFGFFR
ncbi:MAG: hypothetical protein ACKO8Z_01095 [Prosthecobacter sp.]